MPIQLSPESAWSLAALLGLSAAAASACAAWFALGSAAAWQRQKILTSSCSSCWLGCHASTTSKLVNTEKTLIIFHCKGVPSWWQAGWSALMTCPSPPVRVSSLPPVVARTSTSSMSDHIFKEGCRPFKDKSSSRKVFKTLVSSLQLQTSVILMCSNALMSIKQKDKQIFYYCKGTRHHINRLNTIYT